MYQQNRYPSQREAPVHSPEKAEYAGVSQCVDEVGGESSDTAAAEASGESSNVETTETGGESSDTAAAEAGGESSDVAAAAEAGGEKRLK